MYGCMYVLYAHIVCMCVRMDVCTYVRIYVGLAWQSEAVRPVLSTTPVIAMRQTFSRQPV